MRQWYPAPCNKRVIQSRALHGCDADNSSLQMTMNSPSELEQMVRRPLLVLKPNGVILGCLSVIVRYAKARTGNVLPIGFANLSRCCLSIFLALFLSCLYILIRPNFSSNYVISHTKGINRGLCFLFPVEIQECWCKSQLSND